MISKRPSATIDVAGCISDLGYGMVWQSYRRDGAESGAEFQSIAERLAAFAAAQQSCTGPTPAADVIRCALHGAANGQSRGFYRNGDVLALAPELIEELGFCRWSGDGHFDLTPYKNHTQVPTLGQIIKFVRMATSMAGEARLTIHVSSDVARAPGAVLAGAVLVLAGRVSAQDAWAELQKSCPPLETDASKNWDRFPAPFSPTGSTYPCSLSVLDCLEGLEVARRLGWLDDYRVFDVDLWQYLREKLDASWLIPGKLLALGHPCATARNPRFPGLLQPPLQPWVPDRPPEGILANHGSLAGLGRPDSKTSIALPSRSSPLSADSRESNASFGSLESWNWDDSMNEHDSLKFSDSKFSDDEHDSTNGEALRMRGVRAFTQTRSTSKHSSTSRSTESTVDPGGRLNLLMDATMMNFIMDATDADDRHRGDLHALQDDTFMSYFARKRIVSITRLNESKECKDEDELISLLTTSGFDCSKLSFPDGSVPSKGIVKAFIERCNSVEEFGGAERCDGGAMALHCMQGLGRTGVIAGAYAVSRYGVSGKAFHGWSRICRPGSVQTPEQETFLRGLKQKSDVHSPAAGGAECLFQ